mgnify:CR=1 FL=1
MPCGTLRIATPLGVIRKMLILTKIHKAQFIEDMFNKEYLYFNSLRDFRDNSKDGTGRLDPRELNLKNEQLTTLTIQKDDKEIHLHKVLKGFSGQYIEHMSEPKINCCSLHWLEIESGQSPSTFNHKLIEMGDKALLIYDWKKFFEILDQSLENLKLEYSRKKVEYYNPKTFSDDLSLHHKNEEFKWQNEYRILIAPTNNKPLKIPLKGMKEISCVIDSKAYHRIRIKIEN